MRPVFFGVVCSRVLIVCRGDVMRDTLLYKSSSFLIFSSKQSVYVPYIATTKKYTVRKGNSWPTALLSYKKPLVHHVVTGSKSSQSLPKESLRLSGEP